jgi:hypothetical protein
MENNKIGRNDSCPCGSGKKYKKCCLKEDQKKEQAQIVQPATQTELASKKVREEIKKQINDETKEQREERIAREKEEKELYQDLPKESENEDDNEEYDEENNTIDQNKFTYPDCEQIEPLDPITPEAEVICANWWEEFETKNSTKEKQTHFNNLIQSNPEVLVYLDLPEILFSISEILSQEEYGSYVEYLTTIRQQIPEVYEREYAYFDEQIIIYKILQGKQEELPKYLDLYKRYPNQNPESLFKILDFMMVSDNEDVLVPFIEDIYRYILGDENVIGGNVLVTMLVFSYTIPYIRENCTDEDFTQLSKKLQSLEAAINEDMYSPEYLKEHVHRILGACEKWDLKGCSNRREISKRYWDISLNFMGFLHTEKKMNWVVAHFYQAMLFEYLTYSMPEGKRPKDAFIFTKDRIRFTQSKRCQNMGFINATAWGAMLNGIYHFAEYLEKTSSIAFEKRQEIQTFCTEIFEEDYSILSKHDYSVQLFEKFPQYA